MRAVALGALLAAVVAAPASAHLPSTAVGQAVEALASVPVSYENGASVTELEADAFGRLPGVGDDISVAVFPKAALAEVSGGANAIAREVAREAHVRGTVVVLAGDELGASSDAIAPSRLDALVRAASRVSGLAPQVVALVASIDAEPRAEDDEWSWVTIVVPAALVGIAVGGALVVVGRRGRGRPVDE